MGGCKLILRLSGEERVRQLGKAGVGERSQAKMLREWYSLVDRAESGQSNLFHMYGEMKEWHTRASLMIFIQKLGA